MSERVQKIISNAGFCSRRAAEDLIRAGRVTVNGAKVSIGSVADKTSDVICVNGKKLHFGRKIYLLLNKPKGYVCSRNDPQIKKTIYDLVPKRDRVYSVGRLDVMTEGLIILTNDGDFANKIMHPRYEVSKTYQVRLSKAFKLEDKPKITQGMTLQDKAGKPFTTGRAHLSINPRDNTTVYITVHEGKNRVVRRIFERLGYTIWQLVRVRIGPIKIEGVERGRCRELTNEEREALLAGR